MHWMETKKNPVLFSHGEIVRSETSKKKSRERGVRERCVCVAKDPEEGKRGRQGQ